MFTKRRIRQTLRADYYYPNMTAEQRKYDLDHTGNIPRTSVLGSRLLMQFRPLPRGHSNIYDVPS